MYFGTPFGPVSLLGLLFRGSPVASGIPQPAISVVVPVRNGEKTIEKCVKSIEEQQHPIFELILIDDASTDMTPILLGKISAKYRNIKILRNQERLGKAASINKALEKVQAPLVAVIDADTLLDTNYFFEVSKAFFKKDVVGASGMILPSKTSNTIEKSRLIEYLHGQSTYKPLQEKIGVMFVLAGCCSIWRTEWLKENKIPTETVVEDMDLTWEAQIKGKKVCYITNAVAYTDEPETLSKFAKQMERWFSWRPVVEKHAKEPSLALKTLVLWMLTESIGFLVWLGVTLYFALNGQVLSSFLMFLFDVSIVTLVSIWQGHKLRISVNKIFSSLPRYYLLRLPTAFLFWKSFIKPKRTGW